MEEELNRIPAASVYLAGGLKIVVWAINTGGRFMAMLSFKEFEHQAWQKAVDQYDASFSRLTRQMIPAVMDVLGIREGKSFLDVACGPGYLAAAAHRKGAKVSGVDFSSSMVSRAKQLHPGIDFNEGDAEDLEKYQDAHFDASPCSMRNKILG